MSALTKKKADKYADYTRYTYADYAKWDEDIRVEIIDGLLYPWQGSVPVRNLEEYIKLRDLGIENMAGASAPHQSTLVALAYQLYGYLRGKRCKVFVAPFDVVLNSDTIDEVTFQPDILVVCDPNKYKNGKRCEGAPDFAIEILSPSTTQEYWIVDPICRVVEVSLWHESGYLTSGYGEDDEIPVMVLDNCILSMTLVFEEYVDDVDDDETEVEESQ
jgi:Uma2 family endonuclease